MLIILPGPERALGAREPGWGRSAPVGVARRNPNSRLGVYRLASRARAPGRCPGRGFHGHRAAELIQDKCRSRPRDPDMQCRLVAPSPDEISWRNRCTVQTMNAINAVVHGETSRSACQGAHWLRAASNELNSFRTREYPNDAARNLRPPLRYEGSGSGIRKAPTRGLRDTCATCAILRSSRVHTL